MNIFKTLWSGLVKALQTWKGILIVWFTSLLMISLVTFPLKGAVKSGFGKSMITDKLTDGIDMSVVTDLLSNATSLIPSFSSGLFLVLLTGFLLSTFLNGGLFNSLKKSEKTFSSAEFFAASSRNFWSFLVISLLISGIILFLGFLMVLLPVTITLQSKSAGEGSSFMTLIISGALYLVSVMILYMVADYARAWQVKNEKNSCFIALGYGFSKSFGKFPSSFPVMLITIVVQILFVLLALTIIGYWKPVTGGGVFLLFLVSQLLVITRLTLKTWRYGCITFLSEVNEPPENISNLLQK
jgi:hypothetical protein